MTCSNAPMRVVARAFVVINLVSDTCCTFRYVAPEEVSGSWNDLSRSLKVIANSAIRYSIPLSINLQYIGTMSLFCTASKILSVVYALSTYLTSNNLLRNSDRIWQTNLFLYITSHQFKSFISRHMQHFSRWFIIALKSFLWLQMNTKKTRMTWLPE